MGSWWRSSSDALRPATGAGNGHPPASYSLVILRRARSGDSGIDVADERGQWGQLPSLEEVLRRPSWMELAACAGMPIDVFFPAQGQTAAAARAICSTCKVQPECLNYARADSDTMGFWGGTSERERRHHGQVA